MAEKFVLPDEIHSIILDFDEKGLSINGEKFGKDCEKFEVSLYCGGAAIYARSTDGHEEKIKYKRTPGVPGVKRE